MSVKKASAALAAAAMVFGFAPSASATVTSVKDCAFGPAQVFDVQYNFSGGNLNISGITRPYGNVNGQLSESQWTTGYYLKFVDSVSNPGGLALERFNDQGVSQGLLSSEGSFRAYGEDFIFFLGGGFYGTVITTGAGYAYGSSAALAVTAENPSIETITSYTNCLATPLDAGETRDDAGGGGGGDPEEADATLALNLKVRVGQILAGKEVDYTGEGLMSESEYVLELHSDVVVLGGGTTDSNGTFTDTVTLPDGIEPGPHQIVLRGTDPDGNTLERIAYIYVGEDGTLLAKSFRGPIDEADLLASTGLSDYNPALVAASAGLAVALGAVVLSRRRTGRPLG